MAASRSLDSILSSGRRPPRNPDAPPTLGKTGNDQADFERGLMNESAQWAHNVTDPSREELGITDSLGRRADAADANVDSEMRALHSRGEDLADVNQDYMYRAYQPAYERLMQDYGNMDQNIKEDMNRRGIGAQGSSADNGTGYAGSEPEMYQRMLLSRDTKNQLGRNMLEAQNQAVQQKLAQYQGRTAETNQANTRWGQTMQPYLSAKVTSADNRLNARTSAATGMAGTRFGYAEGMHGINSQRQMAGQDRMDAMIGAGIAGAGAGIQAMSMSDENVKTDIHDAESPDESLQDLDRLQVKKWKYKMGGGEHTGAMAQDMPGDISPDGKSVDVVSYLGKLTQAVQALSSRVGRYEQLSAQGGV